MGRKAGILITLAAVAAAAGIAAGVVFAGDSGSATVKRADTIHMRAQIETGATARVATAKHHLPPVKYGVTRQPQVIPPGTVTSVVLSGCPRRYHITNGSVAAAAASDVQYLTIHGSGPVPGKKGVKRWFVDLSNSNSTIAVNAVGFIVCQH